MGFFSEVVADSAIFSQKWSQILKNFKCKNRRQVHGLEEQRLSFDAQVSLQVPGREGL
jgi:hypothetical protein